MTQKPHHSSQKEGKQSGLRYLYKDFKSLWKISIRTRKINVSINKVLIFQIGSLCDDYF